MRQHAVLASVVLAVLVAHVAVSPSSGAESEPEYRQISQQFGPGYDDTGNVSWFTASYGNTSWGGNRLYADAGDYLYVWGIDGVDLTVGAEHDGRTSEYTLRYPEDGVLSPGFYENAVYPNGRDAPSVRLDGRSDECNPLGSFEIKAATPEVDRLWVVFHNGCRDGVGGAAAEIRYNMPGDPRIDTAPSTVDQMHRPVGGYTRPAAVTLMNRSDRPVRVSAVRVEGSDAWSRRWSTCSTIAADDFCRVWIRFAPSSTGVHEATVRATTSAGEIEVPLRGVGHARGPRNEARPTPSAETDAPPQPVEGSGRQSRSQWLMESERDMWIGSGRAHAFGPQDQYGVGGTDGGIQFSAETSNSDLDGVLWAASGEAMLPGTDVRVPWTHNRTAKVSGDHRGCGDYEGDSRVLEADYDLFGSLERIVITFRMNCAGRDANLWGTVAHNALGPIPLPPGFPPGSTLNATYSTRTPVAKRPFAITGRFATSGPSRPRGLLVEYRDRPGARWFQHDTGRTDRQGRYTIRTKVREARQLRVRFPGTGEIAPSASAPQWIRPR